MPSSVRPSLYAAPTDVEGLWHNGCFASQRTMYPKTGCIFGKSTGKFRVVLVGDSHASAWFPAVERVAKARGWRLETFVKASCVPLDMRQYSHYLGREYTECRTYLNTVVRRLAAHPPDLLIITAARIAIYPMRSADNSTSARISAFARMINRLHAKQKLILGDVPWPGGQDVVACLRMHRVNYGRCAIPNWASSLNYGVLERGAARITGAARIDIVRAGWCNTSSRSCPVVVRGMITYRDRHHLTATFSRSMGPVLNSELRRILPRLPDGTAPTPSPTPTPEPSASEDPGATPTPDASPSSSPPPDDPVGGGGADPAPGPSQPPAAP
ncbi:MAG: SGNH hydrolase domain-containing protein [Chloroflexota bacterium]